MNSKKNLIVGGIIIVVLIAGAFLWKGGFLRKSAETAQPQTAQSEIEKLKGLVNSAKMTDEIYIEMMTEIAQNTFKNPGRTQEETLAEIGKINEKIQNKYGISNAEYVRYAQALNEDKVRFAAMQEKLIPIMTELLKAKK